MDQLSPTSPKFNFTSSTESFDDPISPIFTHAELPKDPFGFSVEESAEKVNTLIGRKRKDPSDPLVGGSSQTKQFRPEDYTAPKIGSLFDTDEPAALTQSRFSVEALSKHEWHFDKQNTSELGELHNDAERSSCTLTQENLLPSEGGILHSSSGSVELPVSSIQQTSVSEKTSAKTPKLSSKQQSDPNKKSKKEEQRYLDLLEHIVELHNEGERNLSKKDIAESFDIPQTELVEIMKLITQWLQEEKTIGCKTPDTKIEEMRRSVPFKRIEGMLNFARLNMEVFLTPNLFLVHGGRGGVKQTDQGEKLDVEGQKYINALDRICELYHQGERNLKKKTVANDLEITPTTFTNLINLIIQCLNEEKQNGSITPDDKIETIRGTLPHSRFKMLLGHARDNNEVFVAKDLFAMTAGRAVIEIESTIDEDTKKYLNTFKHIAESYLRGVIHFNKGEISKAFEIPLTSFNKMLNLVIKCLKEDQRTGSEISDESIDKIRGNIVPFARLKMVLQEARNNPGIFLKEDLFVAKGKEKK